MNAIVDNEIKPLDSYFQKLEQKGPPPEVLSVYDYQKFVDWTCTDNVERSGIAYAALGLAGESGETVDAIKKIIRDGRDITERDVEFIKQELGDVLWYVTRLANLLGVPVMNVMFSNVEKLNDRIKYGKRD